VHTVGLGEIVKAYGSSCQGYYKRMQQDDHRREQESIILEAVQKERTQLQ
jgi:hypothetical protein